MEPFLWHGDLVQVSAKKTDDPAPGEVYVIWWDGMQVAHRFREKRVSDLLFQGDRQPQGELVSVSRNAYQLEKVLDRAAPPSPPEVLLGLVGLSAREGHFGAVRNCTLCWDWPEICRLAQKHRLLSLLAYMLKESGAWREAPLQVQEMLLRALAQDIERCERIDRVKTKVERALPAARALKGVAVRAMYPEPYLRNMRDVDFLVGQADYGAALEKLSAEGFRWSDHDRKKATYYHQTSLTDQENDLEVEIHASLFQRYRYQFDSSKFLLGRETSADLVVYLCAHAVSHWGQHLALSLDIFLALQKTKPEPEDLACSAEENGALLATAFLLQGVREWWNVDKGTELRARLGFWQRLRLLIACEFFLNHVDLQMMSTAKRLLQFLLADDLFQFVRLYFDPGRRRLARGG